MDFWTAIVAIVAMGCGVGALSVWTDHRKAGSKASDDELERMQRALDAQAERLASLEAIVVDGRYDLRRELDQLEADGRPN